MITIDIVHSLVEARLEFIETGDPTKAGYSFHPAFHDYHSGDNYGSIYAHKDGNRVGHLDFVGNEHSVLISHVGVHPDHKRKGLAMAMIHELTNKHFKGAKLDWGMTTPEGTKLKAAWEKDHPPPPPPWKSRHGSRFGGRSKRTTDYDPEERQHQRSPFIPYHAPK